METPSNPQQKGQVGVQHDDRPDSAHEQELRNAERGETSVKHDEKNED